MASQQTVISETIRAMKLAIKRKEDDSESDSSIHEHSNRGNKLKRKAHHIREGRLDTSGGLDYRKRIEHGGYSRTIMHQNPPLYDFDGDLVDPDEEHEEEIGSPAEDNPFGDTKLEHLLMPLTSAPALVDHPALSAPYTAEHLDNMIDSAQRMLQRERETLWKVKGYLQSFRGDDRWAPLEKMEAIQDPLLLEGDGFNAEHDERSVDMSTNGLEVPLDNKLEAVSPFTTGPTNGTNNMLGIQMQAGETNGIETTDMALQHLNDQSNGDKTAHDSDKPETNGHPVNGEQSAPAQPENPAEPEAGGTAMEIDGERRTTTNDNDDETAGDAPSHAMTTRAKARTPPPSDGALSPSSSTPYSTTIAPFFLPPNPSIPDQTLGLPLQEADDTRRLLLLYVQKQEEVIRGVEHLLFGLLKADRYRKDVWRWCKAEAHVGEMSDGEDWYDREEWGLSEDLVKGKEEEVEEDEGKRRGRRREGKGRNAAGGG